MKRSILSTAVLFALAACGGGGGSDVEVPKKVTVEIVDDRGTSNPPPATPPNNPPPDQPPPDYTPPEPEPDPEPEPPKEHEGNPGFTATLHSAPPDGKAMCGIQFLQVEGTGIKNVELVDDDSYERYWVFNVNPAGTYAWAWFDPRFGFNPGPISVRILAWDETAGKMANQITVMPARTWNILPNCQSPGGEAGEGIEQNQQ